MVITNPAASMKKIILETRHPALATPLKPNIAAIIEKIKNNIASVKNVLNIIVKIL